MANLNNLIKYQVFTVLYHYILTNQDENPDKTKTSSHYKPKINFDIFMIALILNWLVPYGIIILWSILKQIKVYKQKKTKEEGNKENKEEKDTGYRVNSLQRTNLTILLTIILFIVSPLILIVLSQYLAFKAEERAYSDKHGQIYKSPKNKRKNSERSKRSFQDCFKKFYAVFRKNGDCSSKEESEIQNKTPVEFVEAKPTRNSALPNISRDEMCTRSNAINTEEILQSDNTSASLNNDTPRHCIDELLIRSFKKGYTVKTNNEARSNTDLSQIKSNDNRQEGDQTEPSITLETQHGIHFFSKKIEKQAKLDRNTSLSNLKSKIEIIEPEMLPKIEEDFEDQFSSINIDRNNIVTNQVKNNCDDGDKVCTKSSSIQSIVIQENPMNIVIQENPMNKV